MSDAASDVGFSIAAISPRPRSNPRITVLAVAIVTYSISTWDSPDEMSEVKFVTHRTSFRSADKQMTSPLSKVASISCVVSLEDPPDATGSESILSICAGGAVKYEVLAVSAWSPRVLSWKHTIWGLSVGAAPARETYVKRCVGVLEEPFR